MTIYNNSVITLTEHSAPDPFVIHAFDRFYLTFTCGNRLEVWSSPSLIEFSKTASKHVLWVPPPSIKQCDLWAPELHAIKDRWYIYYAAAHPALGNKSHRTYVLGGPPVHKDPCTGGLWEYLGPLIGLPDQWSIDGTIFHIQDRLYFAYSGWLLGDDSMSDLMQYIYIVEMRDALSVWGPPSLICRPEAPFEFTRDGGGLHGINEGPQWLEQPNGPWKGLIYSCAGSWTNEYKMNTLSYNGGDPLASCSWIKGSKPLCQTSPGRGPWGPGHGTFLDIGDETFCVFHAADGPADGWQNRRIRCQKVAWNKNFPFMGGYVGLLTNDFDVFTKGHKQSEPERVDGRGFKALIKEAAQKIMR